MDDTQRIRGRGWISKAQCKVGYKLYLSLSTLERILSFFHEIGIVRLPQTNEHYLLLYYFSVSMSFNSEHDKVMTMFS